MTPEETVQMVSGVLREEQSRALAERDRRRSRRGAASGDHQPRGGHPEISDRAVAAIEYLASMPDADQVAAEIAEDDAPRLLNLETALRWLTEFAERSMERTGSRPPLRSPRGSATVTSLRG